MVEMILYNSHKRKVTTACRKSGGISSTLQKEDVPVCVANCPNEALVYVETKDGVSC